DLARIRTRSARQTHVGVGALGVRRAAPTHLLVAAHRRHPGARIGLVCRALHARTRCGVTYLTRAVVIGHAQAGVGRRADLGVLRVAFAVAVVVLFAADHDRE